MGMRDVVLVWRYDLRGPGTV